MSALSQATVRNSRTANRLSFKVKNASTVYPGGWISLEASSGYAIAYTGAPGERLLGMAVASPDPTNLGVASVVGATSSIPIPEITVLTGDFVLEKVAVTGVTAITDVGLAVYASNDNDLTITRAADKACVGKIVRWHTSTTCDVYIFPMSVRDAMKGQNREVITVGSADAVNGIADTTLFKSFPSGAFRLKSVYAVVHKALAGGTSITITASNSGTALTAGGVISLTTDATGTVATGTAITQDSAADFDEGDDIRFTCAVVGTYTNGAITLFAEIERPFSGL